MQSIMPQVEGIFVCKDIGIEGKSPRPLWPYMPKNLTQEAFYCIEHYSFLFPPNSIFGGWCIPLVKLRNGLDQCIMHVDIAPIISRVNYDT